MHSALILAAIILTTLIGDYLIKLASQKPSGLVTAKFIVGAILYALPAVGWFYLMRSHSLATIAVLYSAGTILILGGLGYFVFQESLGRREILGMTLAIAAVIAVSR